MASKGSKNTISLPTSTGTHITLVTTNLEMQFLLRPLKSSNTELAQYLKVSSCLGAVRALMLTFKVDCICLSIQYWILTLSSFRVSNWAV